MTRKRKTRKIGPVGVRSTPKEERKQSLPTKGKKISERKGLPSGSRFSPKNKGESDHAQNRSGSDDPRHGSKKPVPLVMPEQVKKAPADRQLDPTEELAMLENDDRLQDFLTALEEGETLHVEDQAWVDEQLARYQQLVEELGIDLDDEDDEEL
ncbi:hypothetical protein CWE15_00175 [Aliidiomarina taiwanensis]|uniref:Der GTPase-activating protein YihI n=1 Tax=Aliidiomarina taiwanensis TaxID=946228 RepID=A0A432X8J4_9GAMM|nr:Der GTPase-activating protein YihI [Aliidiomarina taiwanensis]RUO43654.1 hypothetical protein CWE15_00175 [Aliidiomarina taiwanensis]